MLPLIKKLQDAVHWDIVNCANFITALNLMGSRSDLFVIVEVEYMERYELDADNNRSLVEGATRHHIFHGPATKESCEQVKNFIESDPEHTYNTFLNIVSHSDYINGVYE